MRAGNSRRLLPAAAILLAAAAPAVHAEAGNPLNDKFSVSLGGFLLSTKTELRVDGDVRGTEINSGRDLGLKDSDRFRLDAYWRMTPRQKLRLMYFDTNNSAVKTLEREIEIDDDVYPVDLEVKATTKTQVTELAYEFDFLQREKYELGGTFGIHNLSFNFGIEATGNGQNVSESSTAKANGPLPVFGLRGVYRFTPKFYGEAAIQYFSLAFDPYDGSVTDFTVTGAWQFSTHWAVGAGWNSFTTKVDVDGDNFNGSLRWRYGGARIFVTASF
ncbi:MAG TPA: hypothetical protein VFL16_00080 [Steroidobacteraceae bacterium]|nr:hypothetical protein [Steroidobacteraceae bacterium]